MAINLHFPFSAQDAQLNYFVMENEVEQTEYLGIAE
jgi:hypothetical protein